MKSLSIFSLLLIVCASQAQNSNDWGITVNGLNSETGFVTLGDSEGNIYMGGESRSDNVDFDPGIGENLQSDVSLFSAPFISKYDSQGNHLWAFILPLSTQGDVRDLAVDADDGVYVLIYFTGTINANPEGLAEFTSGSSGDALIAHYLSDGTFDFAFSINGEGNADASTLALDNEGNIIVGGSLTNVCDFDPSANTQNLVGDPSGPFMAKYSPSGEYIWAWVNPNDGLSFIQDIEVDDDDNIVIVGSFSVSIDLDPFGTISTLLAQDAQDGYIAKYNSTGILVWSKGFHGEFNEICEGLELLTNGDILIVGNFDGDIDLDPSAAEEIIPTNFSYNGFLVRLTSEGDYVNGDILEAGGDCRPKSAHSNASNDIIVCGSFNGTFSPGPLANHINYGGRDLFVVKYSQSLDYVNSFVVGGWEDDFISNKSMAVSGDKVIITGNYDENFDFAPENLDDPAPAPAGLTDLYLAQYTFGNSIGVNDFLEPQALINIYPNPSSDFIHLSGENELSTYRIIDHLGKIVAQGTTSMNASISIVDLSAGTYIIQLSKGNLNLAFIKH
ncbi:MAG: T9SS type A sorting domain-containing protein [Cryomorphaceae bacterium]|nr:T9SS type A sorting domain-containing protein [Cryomorphaceae bacterium]